mmetsp:Transcript_1953/g.4596  ORF Transcript_1953/g.4596 Transcript_1953/m.4596 type:complete len:724 (-) Transcript_1953:928-3099(-)
MVRLHHHPTIARHHYETVRRPRIFHGVSPQVIELHQWIDLETGEDAARPVELADVLDGRARSIFALFVRVVVQEFDDIFRRRSRSLFGVAVVLVDLDDFVVIGRFRFALAVVRRGGIRFQLLLLGIFGFQHLDLLLAHVLDVVLEVFRVEQIAEHVLHRLPLPLRTDILIVLAVTIVVFGLQYLLFLVVLELPLQGNAHLLLPLNELSQVAKLFFDQLPQDLVKRTPSDKVEAPYPRLLSDAVASILRLYHNRRSPKELREPNRTARRQRHRHARRRDPQHGDPNRRIRLKLQYLLLSLFRIGAPVDANVPRLAPVSAVVQPGPRGYLVEDVEVMREDAQLALRGIREPADEHLRDALDLGSAGEVVEVVQYLLVATHSVLSRRYWPVVRRFFHGLVRFSHCLVGGGLLLLLLLVMVRPCQLAQHALPLPQQTHVRSKLVRQSLVGDFDVRLLANLARQILEYVCLHPPYHDGGGEHGVQFRELGLVRILPLGFYVLGHEFRFAAPYPGALLRAIAAAAAATAATAVVTSFRPSAQDAQLRPQFARPRERRRPAQQQTPFGGLEQRQHRLGPLGILAFQCVRLVHDDGLKQPGKYPLRRGQIHDEPDGAYDDPRGRRAVRVGQYGTPPGSQHVDLRVFEVLGVVVLEIRRGRDDAVGRALVAALAGLLRLLPRLASHPTSKFRLPVIPRRARTEHQQRPIPLPIRAHGGDGLHRLPQSHLVGQ